MDDLEHRRELRRQKREELWRQAERLTAQRSMEDEEEIARERRRRARDERRYDQDDNGSFTSSTSSTPVFESLSTTAENQYNFNYKSTNSALDEDEGFSDWTQRREERRQKRREELSQIEKDHVDESQTDRAYALRDRKGLEDQEGPSVCKLKMWQIEEEERKMHQRQQREQEEEEENRQRRAHERQQREMEEMERAQKYLDEKDRFKYEREEKERLNLDSMQKERRKLEVEKRPKDNEVKMSHTATAWTEHSCYEEENNDMIQDKMASFHGYRATKTMLSEFPETDEDGELTRLEAEQKLEQIRRSLDEKENLEYERLRQRGHDAELELEELKKRREDRRKLREEEEQRRQQQELEEQAREEISERTESLNRSLKKSNSIKKTQPITNISKIDERLEQYTSAIESTTKSLRHTSLDMPNLPEDVATKKNLWESGDVAGYSVAKGTPCKDTDGLKVGVCDLINQWVSKNPESNTKASPSKPAEIKVGDVRSKKNIWENKGDSHSITKSQHTGKNHPSGTRYKFVVVGHGMYEKIPITDDENGTDQNSQSSEVEHFIEEH
ncbi:non-muscle caldesmon isoform X5 [Chiloscyllium plagiosum]|uniref:non-muscle caldesmon isoform X5 n=1 Tax=Chiloscyllium plagiosum TaxID=36176 RepID=UPI001CB8014D|nr:non-muscle caldesmon isoform X5 [Chiloscyllium plagiosum]